MNLRVLIDKEWIHYSRWSTHFIHWDMAISDKVIFTDKVGLYFSRYILAKMADNIVSKIPKPSVSLLQSLNLGYVMVSRDKELLSFPAQAL
jgi:hypothetical protein